MIRIIRSIDVSILLESYLKLEKNINWTEHGHQGKQAGIQYCQGEDPWVSAVGKGYGDQTRYNVLNPIFSGTVFEDLIKEFKMFRTRFMWVHPYACYSMHSDLTPRIHFPIITNPECYFVFQKGPVFHLKEGNAWWIDTTKRHSFMNCSDHPRLHLIGVVTE